MNVDIVLRVKVNDAGDRRTLSGILTDAGCAVWVEKKEREGGKRVINDNWVVVGIKKEDLK